MGSDTATMRKSGMPPAMTAASGVNRLIMAPGMANRIAPVTVIMPMVTSVMVRDTRRSFFMSPSPRDWPASVEAAVCMP